MKLTHAMRDDFVSDVMRSIKWKSPWTKEKMIEEICKRLRAAVPEEIIAFDRKHPNMLQYESIILDFMKYIEVNEKGDHKWYIYSSAQAIKGTGLNDIDISDLIPAWEAYRAEVASRKEMRDRLNQIAREMQTDEQLRAALPKLAKFVPKPAVKIKAGLPVAMTGIQNELVKMGLAL